jgi:hypothetical protein
MGLPAQLSNDQIKYMTLEQIEEWNNQYDKRFAEEEEKAQGYLKAIHKISSHTDKVAIHLLELANQQTKLEELQKESAESINSSKQKIDHAKIEVIETTKKLGAIDDDLKEIESDESYTIFSFFGLINKVNTCCKNRWEGVKNKLCIAAGGSIAGFVAYYAAAAMTPYPYVAALSAGTGVVVGGATVYCLIRCRDLNNRCCRWIKLRC